MERFEKLAKKEPATIFRKNELQQRILKAERLSSLSNQLRASNSSIADSGIIIPIVVHVLYNNSEANIPDSQIQSQIDILNEDFNRKNADTINTPSVFLPLAARLKVHFQLATTDINGNPTTGIIRKQTSIQAFGDNDDIKFNATGGDNAWDARKYLNIWVSMLSDDMLGYSSFPADLAAHPEKDGIVINYQCFGKITKTPSTPYDKGRTATHELGHWLDLYHTWGDEDNCNADDLIDDTPMQAKATSVVTCPTSPRTSCNNAALGGDMYMNYMDYSPDQCMNIFTKDQVARMKFVLDSVRAFKNGSIPKDSLPSALRIGPNPSLDGKVTLYNSWEIGDEINIYNLQGAPLRNFKISSIGSTFEVDLSKEGKGLYFFKINKRGNSSLSKILILPQ
jgi:hypothetical protein